MRVYWFADEINISSPGGVYGDVTKENFGTGITSYRNPTIAEAIKNMGFMQQFGIGLAMVHKELKNNGNPPANFDINENFISVTIKKTKMKTIAFFNNKGGVGKTSLVYHLAWMCSELNHRIITADFRSAS